MRILRILRDRRAPGAVLRTPRPGAPAGPGGTLQNTKRRRRRGGGGTAGRGGRRRGLARICGADGRRRGGSCAPGAGPAPAPSCRRAAPAPRGLRPAGPGRGPGGGSTGRSAGRVAQAALRTLVNRLTRERDRAPAPSSSRRSSPRHWRPDSPANITASAIMKIGKPRLCSQKCTRRAASPPPRGRGGRRCPRGQRRPPEQVDVRVHRRVLEGFGDSHDEAHAGLRR